MPTGEGRERSRVDPFNGPKESEMTPTLTQSDMPHRALVLLPSGNVADLAVPDPHSWKDADLAAGLSRTFRWGGHSAWLRPLSVAQHSLTVLAIREMTDGALDPDHALFELLHDGEEGLLGFDCIAPLKPQLGAPFAALCERLTSAIAVRYSLPELTQAQYRLHKDADMLAAASEAAHVAGWSTGDIASVLKLSVAPLESDPLDPGPYAPWEPWPSDYAATRWLDALDCYRARRTQPAPCLPDAL
jgi:5'-deoxynucleotidase YfbR-like HD superfamily hydrolase